MKGPTCEFHHGELVAFSVLLAKGCEIFHYIRLLDAPGLGDVGLEMVERDPVELAPPTATVYPLVVSSMVDHPHVLSCRKVESPLVRECPGRTRLDVMN